jgi:hypothetical protein
MFGNHLEMSETFAEVRASRNIIETVSFSQRNHVHVNVCAPVEPAPSWQATNGQRRYSCRALEIHPGALNRERKYD